MALSYDEKTHTLGYKLYDEADEREQEQGGRFALMAPIPAKYQKTYRADIHYQIKAIEQKEEVLYNLIHGGKGVFYADTPYGRFHFEFKRTPRKYIGDTLPPNTILRYLEPLDMYLQEKACMQHQFFFVGESSLDK